MFLQSIAAKQNTPEFSGLNNDYFIVHNTEVHTTRSRMWSVLSRYGSSLFHMVSAEPFKLELGNPKLSHPQG